MLRQSLFIAAWLVLLFVHPEVEAAVYEGTLKVKLHGRLCNLHS